MHATWMMQPCATSPDTWRVEQEKRVLLAARHQGSLRGVADPRTEFRSLVTSADVITNTRPVRVQQYEVERVASGAWNQAA